MFALVAVGTLAGAAGCHSSTDGQGAGGKADQPNSKSAAGTSTALERRCQALLSSALEMIKPENLNISSEPMAVVGVLNNWVRDCPGTAPGDAKTVDPLVAKHVPEAERASADSELYDIRDVDHIRTCWLLKQCGSPVVQAAKTDVDRAVGLFELMTDTIAASSPSEPLIPHSLYEVAVLGKGSAEDRAWFFAELLRQLGIDTVILRPKPRAGGPSAASKHWLVGVVLEKDVYLFDPILGWPIPSDQDDGQTARVRRPATLSEVVAKDSLLRKLDVSAAKPYPLRSEDLKSLQVELVTSCRYWLSRTRRVQAYLAGSRSAEIYTPLGEVGGKPGLLARIAAAGAGNWKADDVIVWDYPDRQNAAALNRDPQAAARYALEWLPFDGPVEVTFNVHEKQPKVGAGNRKLIKARVAQLQGDCALAIRNFLLVQLDELQPTMELPPEMQRPGGPNAFEVPKKAFAINYRASEDAKYWMGTAHLQQRDLRSAGETLSAYLIRYGQGGMWVAQAALLHALTQAEAKQFALSVQSISQLARALADDDPRRIGCELFANRWRALRQASSANTSDSATKSAGAPGGESKAAPAGTDAARTDSAKTNTAKPGESKSPEKKPTESKPPSPKPADSPTSTPKPAKPDPGDAKASDSKPEAAVPSKEGAPSGTPKKS